MNERDGFEHPELSKFISGKLSMTIIKIFNTRRHFVMKRSFRLILSIILIVAFATTFLGLTTISVKSIKLNTTSIKIQVGKTYKLKVTITPDNATNKKVVFSSGNKSIASVDKNGIIKGVKPGKTVITVTSSNNIKAKCNVTVENALRNKLTIRWMFNANPNDIVEGNVLQKELESKFNVKIEYVCEDVLNAEKVKLLYSSGEGPDFGFGYQDIGVLYKQKLVRSIPLNLIRQYMPGYTDYMDKHPTGWLYNKAPDKKDEYLAFTGVAPGSMNGGFLAFYRLDWLEKIGIKPKGNVQNIDDGKVYFTDQPFTLDEVEKIFDGFTNKDPDGNGKKDTWGMTGMIYPNYTWGPLFMAFKLPTNPTHGQVIYEGNKLISVITSDNYKSFLKYANKLFAKGYVDPEFAQLAWGPSVEKMNSGMAGFFSMVTSYLSPLYTDRPPYGVLNKNPKAKILVTPPPKGVDGKINYTPYGISQFAYHTPIGSKVNDEKLIRILMMYDYINYTDLKTYVRFNNGPEGLAYEWSGEPWKSTVVYKTQDDNLKKELYKYGCNGITGFAGTSYGNGYEELFNNNKEMSLTVKWVAETAWKNDYIYLPSARQDIFGETKLGDVGKQYNAELDKIRNQFFVKAIIGDVNIDKEWDNYVKSLYDAGLQKIIDELAKAPLMDEFIKGNLKY